MEKQRYPADLARKVAEELLTYLRASCSKAEIVGSLRRSEVTVGDIEILCVPRGVFAGGFDLLRPLAGDDLTVSIDGLIRKGILNYRLSVRGIRAYGPKNKLLRHVASGIPVDIFTTDEDCWPVALVIRTGPKESNIAIANAALRKGWRLHAYGSGFTDENGAEIKCHSERDVFEMVGLPYNSSKGIRND